MTYHSFEVLTRLAMLDGFFLSTIHNISAVAADNEYL